MHARKYENVTEQWVLMSNGKRQEIPTVGLYRVCRRCHTPRWNMGSLLTDLISWYTMRHTGHIDNNRRGYCSYVAISNANYQPASCCLYRKQTVESMNCACAVNWRMIGGGGDGGGACHISASRTWLIDAVRLRHCDVIVQRAPGCRRSLSFRGRNRKRYAERDGLERRRRYRGRDPTFAPSRTCCSPLPPFRKITIADIFFSGYG